MEIGTRRRAETWGRAAESLAAWRLRLKGYRIVARRFRTHLGEIDLIACRGRVLAMVEVKARDEEEAALAALPARQRQRIERAALTFLQQQPRFSDFALRFDLILVVPWRWPRHIIDAWRPA